MSNIISSGLLKTRNLCLTIRRFRGKINIQRPRKPHYERARVVAATTPYYKEEIQTTHCSENMEGQKTWKMNDLHNPYNDIIARDALNWFNCSKTIGIFHCNPISQDDLFPIRVALHRKNIHLKFYGKSILKQALNDTKYEATLPLFVSNYNILFSPEEKAKEMLNITKKCRQMILLAGIADNTLLNRNEFIKYATLPNIQVQRAELVSTLLNAAGQTVNNLELQQNILVNTLDAYKKLLEDKKD